MVLSVIAIFTLHADYTSHYILGKFESVVILCYVGGFVGKKSGVEKIVGHAHHTSL